MYNSMCYDRKRLTHLATLPRYSVFLKNVIIRANFSIDVCFLWEASEPRQTKNVIQSKAFGLLCVRSWRETRYCFPKMRYFLIPTLQRAYWCWQGRGAYYLLEKVKSGGYLLKKKKVFKKRGRRWLICLRLGLGWKGSEAKNASVPSVLQRMEKGRRFVDKRFRSGVETSLRPAAAWRAIQLQKWMTGLSEWMTFTKILFSFPPPHKKPRILTSFFTKIPASFQRKMFRREIIFLRLIGSETRQPRLCEENIF